MRKKDPVDNYPLSVIIANWMRVAMLGIIILFLLIGFVGCVSMMAFDEEVLISGNVAKIPVNGFISVSADVFSEDSTSSTEFTKILEKVGRDDAIRAVMLDINSPGGTPVASYEIASAVKNFEKPVVAVIRDVGASGAYWIASAADWIIVSPLSLTGSIGVRGGHFDISGFLSDHNISYTRFVGGKYKDIGSPFREITPDEEALLQKKVDDIHDYFIESVAENRGMPIAKAREVSTGMYYTGIEAVDIGLADSLGGIDEAKEWLEEEIGEEVNLKPFNPAETFYDLLYGMSSGNGIILNDRVISLS